MRNVISDSSGISDPIKTGSIGDNLSLSFALTRKMIARQWHLMLVMAFFAGIVTVGFTILLPKLNLITPNPSAMTGLVGTAGTIPAYLILYIFLLFRFGRMIRDSEAFTDIPKRNIAAVFGFFIINYVLTILIVAVVTFAFFIIMVIPVIGPFVFMLSLPLYLFFILVFIAVASQPVIYSFFRKVYPLRAWKYSITGLFKRAGHRRGGIFGLNMWHFIGVCLLAFLINMTLILLIYTPAQYLSSLLVPADIPVLGYASTAATTMLSVCIYFMTYYFTFATCAVYVSELLAFGDNGIREEIIARAG